MNDCLFCKIAKHEIQSKIILENDQVVAFEDVHPQAPTHILVVPKKHIATLNDVTPEDRDLLGDLILTAVSIAKSRQVSSFRLVVNTNAGAGQSVFHIHVHLLGGRSLTWPPG